MSGECTAVSSVCTRTIGACLHGCVNVNIIIDVVRGGSVNHMGLYLNRGGISKQ